MIVKNAVAATLMDLETLSENLVNQEFLEDMAAEIQRIRMYVVSYQNDFTLEQLQRVQILLDLLQKSLGSLKQ